MAIQRLSPELAKKIAAGEVVERPLSVVKELLENSIDAGASQVTVELVQGGKVLISVADDGSGIAPQELPLALEKHATSKIATDQDLEAISTLGYRGEALASISAVSVLELYSRRRDLDTGAVAICREGEITVQQSALQPGTRVTVRDLFYNLPARRKFLKSAPAEYRRILRLVEDYALAYPSVAFRLINDGKKSFQSPGDGDVATLLRQLWGLEPSTRRADFAAQAGSLQAWWQDCGASSRFQLTVFVNGRRISDGTIRSAVVFYPWAHRGNWLLFLTLPPEDVDINVHPAKSEILLRRSGEVFDLVRRGVEQFAQEFSQLTLAPKAHQERAQTTAPAPGEYRPAGSQAEPFRQHGAPHRERNPFSRIEAPAFRVASSRSVLERSRGPEPAPSPLISPTERQPELPMVPGEAAVASVDGQERYLGQLASGYLIFEDYQGLLILDPHAAQERVLFERILAACSDPEAVESLVVPVPLPPSLRDDALFYQKELQDLGVHLDDQGNLKALPVHGKGLDIAPLDLLRGALGALEDHGDSRPLMDRWALRACKASVKLTTALEPQEARQLLVDLRRCEQPNACPHGRPTTLRLGSQVLARHFGRQG